MQPRADLKCTVHVWRPDLVLCFDGLLRRESPNVSAILDWPQGTPIDVDPVLMDLDQSPKSFFVTACTSFALAGFALSPPGQRWFGVAPLPLVVFTVLHAALYAHGVWVLGPGAQSGLLWKRRALALAATAAVASVYGACSTNSASPAYAVVIAAAMVFGQTAPGSALVAAMLCVVPVAERAVFVSSASASSLAIAVTAGAASATMYWTVSARSVRLLELRTRVASTGLLTDLAAAREAQLKVAMSLHDGLSGALFAARRRAASAGDTEQVIRVGRNLLLRAYEAIHTCHGGASGVAAELESSLQGVARALGVPGRIAVKGGERTLPADEMGDVRDIALEAVANAARHEVAEIELRIQFAANEVRIECQTLNAANTEPGTGRGFRNTLLRAKSRGGDAKWGGSPERFASTVRWPVGEAFRALPPMRLALEVAASAAFAITLGVVGHSLPALLAPAVALAFGLYVCLQSGERLEQAQNELAASRTRRRDAEQTPVLHAVDSFLVPALTLLEQATSQANVTQVRTALAELADALGDVMWALEWRPAPALAPEGDAHGPSEPRPNLHSLLAERKAERSREASLASA